ncbi:late blight resistance protein R1-A-like [Quercus robur]|uniref:late blight resistance protein R1-A-like n=1 Tax=Quercus robur TaxID=38942 RepID=UPI002163BD21|nr:late blight resistance protein R1-A-like [Quercus robur]
MADSAVSFLLENLTQLLIRESKLLRGVKDQVRSLEKELAVIKIFLRNTEGKRRDELVEEIVSQIRDVAYEAEDVIDTYIITVTEHRRRSKLRKLIHSCDRAITFHEVASNIESIKIRYKEINDNRSKYGIEIAESFGGNAEEGEKLHRRRKHVEEDQVVGFAHDAEVLVKELMEGSLQRNVVSIIGMGGLGKTTLARKIYNNNDVKNYFNFCGWVYVSQEYGIRELLLEILKGLSPLPRVMLRAELKEKLLHGLYATYSSSNDRLKGRLTEDFERFKEMIKYFKEMIKYFKEMNDEIFSKAWSEFLKGVQDHNDLKNSLSNFVQDFYNKNGVKLKAELKEKLLHDLYATYRTNIDRLEGTLTEDLKRFKEMNEPFKEMNDEEFRKAWAEFLEGVQDRNDLKNSLSKFVQDFYSENRVKLEDMTEDELKSVLLESLKDKRYLLVMDDIWNNEVWNEVSTAFPNNSNGSRILITTRIKEVSLHASSVNNYELPLLEEDKSWELFSKKVFWEDTCPPELEILGRELVKSCHGLPLAIVVLGGLLASKEKTHRIWSKYNGHVNSYLTNNKSSCRDILALSYNHLPRRLKPCFLYFGIYPEDFEIPVRQLIRLWIAEGFIQQIGNRNIEDVAEDYLEELIDRSLIQVATKRLDGGVKTCRIHDLLRDFCISESSEEKFLEVHSNVNLSPIGISRRISIHYGNNPYISSGHCKPSNSRSIIGFGGAVELKSPPDNFYLEWICKSNKLVRVVELSNMGICCLIPKGIEKLVLLRHLSIASGELHVIPDSICNLWNLETLDMRNSTVETKCLPKGIWKLQRLRHLYMDGQTSLPRTEKNTAALPNLQVLTGIAINEDTESHFAKARFPNLRKLGLMSPPSGVESGLLSSLCPLCHLQTLKIYRLSRFSSSIWLTLTKITLVDVVIYPAIMEVLGSLTKLRILKFRGSDYVLNEYVLYCNVRSFQQLEVFKMENLLVSKWNMGEGAMPKLQRLVIESCEFICEVPDELWCLSTLRDVEVLHPQKTLARRLRQLQMRDGCKLHVYPPLNPNN